MIENATILSCAIAPIEAYETPALIFLTDGYHFSEHKIITEDDYVLTAWRIKGYLNETASTLKQPIML